MSQDNKLLKLLTNEVLTNILNKDYKNVKIKSVTTNSGSTAGDNNLSEISRVSVTFIAEIDKSGTAKSGEIVKSFIIKYILTAEGALEFVNSVKGYEKENSWYLEVQPEFEKLKINISPKCYAKFDNFLLLEDLNMSGYKVFDRKKMLDFEHSKAAVIALAKMHAVTHCLYVNNKLPGICIEKTLFIPENIEKVYLNFKHYDFAVESLKKVGIDKYEDKIKRLKSTSWDTLMSCFEKDDFKCLTHSDFWTTNMLFKDGDKIDTQIIDFQLITLGIPSYDLHFFICTSMKPEVRNDDRKLDEILNCYLASLNSTLKEIGCGDLVDGEKFHRVMNETEFFGLFTTLNFLPVPMCEEPIQFSPPENSSPEEKEKYDPFAVVYTQETHRNLLISLLEYYERRGVL